MIALSETELPSWIPSRCQDLSLDIPSDILWVSIQDQYMVHFRQGKAVEGFTISTSRQPPSCVENSFGTPTGLHQIVEKIGDGAQPGTVFKSRIPAGHISEYSEEEQARNYVTTRIMRMRGLEVGHNLGPGVDTYDRYVYIHGTNHPERIGRPFSGGCVEMIDEEIVLLFAKIDTGSLVAISG